MSAGRFAIFLTIVFSIWAAMHGYVLARLFATPIVTNHISRRNLVIILIGLCVSYPLARFLDHWRSGLVSNFLEFAGAIWVGTLFLLFCMLLMTDVVTLGGFALPRLAPTLRSWVVAATGVFTVVALFQGLRAPVVRQYEVVLPGLPKERDGLVLVQISDLHLGSLIGKRWLGNLVGQVQALKPDLLVVVGDLVDGNVEKVSPLLPELKRLQAPLGVWAVTGNHEYYAGLNRSLNVMEAAGFKVLRDRSAEVIPGLVLAGVDDLTARGEFGDNHFSVTKVLSERAKGASILLSHSPLQVQAAAEARAGLMLCGHTHNGQIWPFNYFVRMRYDFLGGRYRVEDMSLVVCRGTGTWGPRMRLWHPSEIVRITLRAQGS